MIIVNKFADYSAVSIGNVEIQIEYREETKVLLAKYTKILSTEQKIALDNFVGTLITEGLWDSLVNLYMPMLASSPSEALYNAVKNTEHTVSQDNDYYSIGSFGLKTNKNGLNKSVVAVETTEGYNNVTFGGFRLTPGLVEIPNKYLMYDNKSAMLVYNGLGAFINNNSYPSTNVTLDTDTDRNFVVGMRKTNTDYKFYTADCTIIVNGITLEAFPDTWDGNVNNYRGKELYIASYSNAYNESGENEALIVLQLNKATDDEMLTINNAIKRLIDDFCV